MSSLKERFEHYEQQPDERVWNRIEETMHTKIRRTRLRMACISAGIVAVVVIAAVATHSTSTEKMLEQRRQLTATTQTESLRATVENVTTAESDKGDDAMREDRPVLTMEPTVAPETTVDNNETVSEPTATPNTNRQTETTQREERNAAPTVTAQETRTEPTPHKTAPNNTITKSSNEPPKSSPQKQTPKVQKTGTDSLVVWIPNAFSPDDPVNDNVRVFKVFPNTNASIISYEIYIYSRTGRQVYHSRDINAGWDGTYNGHAQPMGAYVYIIEVNDAVAGLQHKKGTVTLIR